jgi:ABC-type sulfate transport system permease subunit
MRAIAVVFTTVFLAVIMFVIAGAAIEPLGQEVKKVDEINEGPLDGDSVIDSTFTMLFVLGPMTLIAGIGIWAMAWYFRREQFQGRV